MINTKVYNLLFIILTAILLITSCINKDASTDSSLAKDATKSSIEKLEKDNSKIKSDTSVKYDDKKNNIVPFSDKVIENEIRKILNNKKVIYRKDLEKIETLKLRDKEISSLVDLNNLYNLKRLDLIFCKVKKIGNLTELKSLNQIEIHGSKLPTIDFLTKYRNLKNLYINIGVKGDLDLSIISKLESLEILFIKNNPFKNSVQIPSLNKLLNLKKLLIESFNLDTLGNLKNLNKLSELNLTSNNISNNIYLSLPTSIEKLDLRYNDFDNLELLKGLNKLNTLFIGTEKDLDGSLINYLTSLEKIEIYNYSDSMLSQFSNTLNLSNLNNIKEISLNIKNNKIEELSNLTKLKKLAIYKNNITNSNELKLPLSLKELILAECKLEEIDNLNHLINLVSLDINQCNLKEFPNIENLSSLETLVLSDNNFSLSIDLNYEHNKIQNINLRGLKDLKTTDFSCFPNLKNLTIIGCSNLGNFKFLRNLTKLEKIYITYGDITSLEGLENMYSLKELTITSKEPDKMNTSILDYISELKIEILGEEEL